MNLEPFYKLGFELAIKLAKGMSARVLNRVDKQKPGQVMHVYGKKYRVDSVSRSKVKELHDHGAPDKIVKKTERKGAHPDSDADVVHFHRE
jgi:hypothetical protein